MPTATSIAGRDATGGAGVVGALAGAGRRPVGPRRRGDDGDRQQGQQSNAGPPSVRQKRHGPF